MKNRRRRLLWLLAALTLFAAAAWLMTRGEPERKEPEARVVFRHHLNLQEHQRMVERRRLPTAPAPAPGPAATAGQPPPRPRDPVLAALPHTPGKTTVVLEANALANSPIGELLMACARRGKKEDPFEEMKKESGVDLLKDLDRVAVGDKTLLLSGQFQGAKWDRITEKHQGKAYGEQATLYAPKDGIEAPYLAKWGDQLMLVGDSEAELRESIDRLEGRATGPAPIEETSTYGEAYGILGADFLQDLLGAQQPELARQIREAAQRVELHVSAMGDVTMTADVKGESSEKTGDLAKTLGAALALARLKAQASGEHELADLLDFARISPGDSRFAVELALPMAFVEKHLAFCRIPPDAGAAGP